DRIKITGEALKATEIDLLKGLVKEENVTGMELVNIMNGEVKGVIGAFEGIKTSSETAKANADNIRASVKSIDAARKNLEAAGLSFAPYQATYDTIESNVAAFVARIVGDPEKGIYADPEGAKDDSEAEKAKVDKLLATINKAIALKKEEPVVAET